MPTSTPGPASALRATTRGLLALAAFVLLCPPRADGQVAIERVVRLPRSAPGPVVTGLSPFDGSTYFAVGGRELWRTDGTERGTERVRSFQRVSVRGYTGAHLFLNASEPGEADGLWTLSKTTGLVERVSAVPMSGLAAQDDRVVYYSASTPEHGSELWRSDGTEAGTVMVLDVSPGPSTGFTTHQSLPYEGGLFFVGYHDNDPATAQDDEAYLYYTEGARTERLISKPNAVSRGRPALEEAVVVDDVLYFSYEDVDHGLELWSSDGTPTGTSLYRDLRPGPDSSSPHDMVQRGDQLLFFAYSGAGQQTSRLWAKGGGAGLEPIDKPLDAIHMEVAGPAAYFVDTIGGGLWVSNGTADGTRRLAADVLTATDFVALGDTALFLGRTRDYGRELWVTDGSAQGTRMVADLNPGPRGTTTISPMFSDRLRRGPQDGSGGVLFVATTPDGPSLYQAFPATGVTRMAPEGATVTRGTLEGSRTLYPSQGALYFEGRFFSDDPALYRLVSAYTLPTQTEAPGSPTFRVGAVSPNPARGEARLPFTLDAPATVHIVLYDALGRHVRTGADGEHPAGSQEVELRLDGLPAGLYVVRAAAQGHVVTRPLVVVR